ncbi:hypothetical protein T492DRAFT_1022416, partial [Pavlovales sp. CCMP2436]
VPRVPPVRTPSDTRTPRLDARIGPGGPMRDVGERQTPRRPHGAGESNISMCSSELCSGRPL